MSTALNRPVEFTAARRGGCGLKTKTDRNGPLPLSLSKSKGVTGTVFSLAEPSRLKKRIFVGTDLRCRKNFQDHVESKSQNNFDGWI